MRGKSTISPYQKYNKRPFLYSAAYQQWERLMKEGRSDQAREPGERQMAQFGMVRPQKCLLPTP